MNKNSTLFSSFFFFFGDRTFNCTGSNCSLCGAMVSVFLFPMALLIALIALAFTVAMSIIFVPVFMVIILPCLIITKCRQTQNSNNIVKITESESKNENFLLSETDDRFTVSDLTIGTNCDKSSCTNV